MSQRGDFYKYTRINTATTTQVKTGPGTLKAIIWLSPTAADTVGLIDGIAGTTVNIGTLTADAAATSVTVPFDINFTAGLRIVSSGTSDVLVVWR